MNRDNDNPRRILGVLALGITALAACGPINEDDDDDDGSGSGGGSPAVFERVVGSSASGTTNGAHNVARFNNPVNVEVASDGRVYVADFDNNAIRVISTTGVVSTLVNDASVTATFQRPFGLTISPSDSFLYVQTDTNDTGLNDTTSGTLWRVDRGSGLTTLIARNLGRPRGLQALADGRIVMSDPAHHVITIINPAAATPVETVLAGAEDVAGTTDGALLAARFNRPYGITLLSDGSLLVADQDNNRLRRIDFIGNAVTTFAGGAEGYVDGAIASARFDHPQDVASVGSNIYVSDHDNFRIRRITGGNVTTQAGDGTQGFNDGVGTQASFVGLEGIALNASGSILWIADGDNGNDTCDQNPQPNPNACGNRVRRLDVP